MDYVITDTKNKLYIRLDSEGKPVTCNISQAQRFSQEKANNILNNLPRRLKMYRFELKEIGVIENVDYVPDENITREDICVFFANYMKYLNKEFKSVKGENVFADNSDISDYAAEAVKLCQTAGIINGSDGNMFNPKSFATRSEVAAMTVRFCNLLQ